MLLAKFCTSICAWHAADLHQTERYYLNVEFETLLAAFPRGRFLSDGAYKEVFQVWSKQQERMEAISVMNISAIASTGNEVGWE